MTRLEQIAAARNEFQSYLERCTDTGCQASIQGFGTWLLEETITEQKNESPVLWWYEFRFRGRGPGCQPKGFIDHDDSKGRHGIIAYDRPLSQEEMDEFELRRWAE